MVLRMKQLCNSNMIHKRKTRFSLASELIILYKACVCVCVCVCVYMYMYKHWLSPKGYVKKLLLERSPMWLREEWRNPSYLKFFYC